MTAVRAATAKALSAVTDALGSPTAVILAAVVIAVWTAGLTVVPGGIGNNTYQLLINTGTTIITFLMVFIIQNTANREGRATQVKLDAVLDALWTFAEQGGVELPDDVLSLIGVEMSPDGDIKDAQRQVHDTPPG